MKKLVSSIVRFQETMGMILLTVFFLAILAQIVARYMAVPLLWTEELANYSFIWAVFMGASVMVHYKAHFAFTFLTEKFRGRTSLVYDVVICAILLCFTVPMTLYGVTIVSEFWDYNWITLTWVKMGYTWMCLPIMGSTMTLYIVTHVVEDIRTLLRGGAVA